MVARLGGDEFAILLPETGNDVAGLVLGKIKAGLANAMKAGGWPVTASFGAVTALSVPTNIDTILARADGLTYKSNGLGMKQISHELVAAW